MQNEQISSVTKLNRDLMKAKTLLSDHQARFFVDEYYIIQENRKRAANQARALSESEEPNEFMAWLLDNMETLEKQIKRMLDRYSMQSDTGVWSRSIVGIGPVIAAGLLAHIDIRKAPTVGHIWNFAGLNPDAAWAKGQKRPWNASLKTLCWKIGESFVKVKGRDEAVYGKLYQQRYKSEWQKNLAGEFRQQAENQALKYKAKTTSALWYQGNVSVSKAREIIALPPEKRSSVLQSIKATNIGDEQPMLCPAHINARAKRYAVKLFLSHWHEIAYRAEYGYAPPNPYPIAILGHAHKIEPSRHSG